MSDNKNQVEHFYARSRVEWRQWLEENHAIVAGVQQFVEEKYFVVDREC